MTAITQHNHWTEDIPSVSIELLANGNLRLEDKNYSEFAVIDLHPVHVRLIAEKTGLVRELSASEADTLRSAHGQIAELKRDLGRLRRQMLHVRGCADQLYENITNVQLRGRDDVAVEMAQAAALADFTSEACADFEDDFHVVEREVSRSDRDISVTPCDATQSHVTPSKPPKNGGLRNTTKSGGVRVVETETEPTLNPAPTQAKPLGLEAGAQIGLEV